MQLVEDAMSQTATAKVQVMTIVRLPMVYTVGCRVPIGCCYSSRRSSAIGRCGSAIMHLVVFNCRSAVAVLAWGSHVPGYVHSLVNMAVILDRSLRLFAAGSCRGLVDGNAFLFHARKAKAATVGRVWEREGAELVSMVGEPWIPKSFGTFRSSLGEEWIG